MPEYEYCETTGKIIHRTRARAWANIQKITKQPDFRGGLTEYRCPFCGFYHLANSATAGEWQSTKRARLQRRRRLQQLQQQQ